MQVSVNYLAVLGAAVVNMIVGFLWYGPLFGKPWMKLVGMTDKNMEDAKAGMAKTYGLTFVAALIMAYVLAHFVKLVGATTAGMGVQTGFWAWLGFVATTSLNQYLYSVKSKPWSLYALEQGYWLVIFVINGAILASA